MRQLQRFAAITALLVFSSAASAETLTFKATLSPSSEVPPVTSPGSGKGTFSYDTVSKELVFTITFQGLNSAVTDSHIHGPAGAGANAPVVRTFVFSESPMTGQIRLTDPQAAELVAGQLYIDIHTSSHPDGEIRGQISE